MNADIFQELRQIGDEISHLKKGQFVIIRRRFQKKTRKGGISAWKIFRRLSSPITFIDKDKQEGCPVEVVLKLIKLVYIHLGVNKKPLIRENVEAWKYGPVIRSVYDAFKGYGKLSITDRVATGVDPEMKITIDESIDKSACQFLDKIWNFYRDFQAWNCPK